MKRLTVAFAILLLLLLLLYFATRESTRDGGPSVPDRIAGDSSAVPSAGSPVDEGPATGTDDAAAARGAPEASTPDDVAVVAIRGPDGKPLAGVKVELLRDALTLIENVPEVAASAVTDAAGRVRLPAVPYRRYMLKLSHPDLGVRGDLECFAGNVTEVRMGEAAVLTGQIRDAATGDPVPGATVYCFDYCSVGVLQEWWAETDEEGRYRIEGLGPGYLNVRAWVEGRGLAEVRGAPVVHAGEEARLDFDLPRGVPIMLRVLDEQSGAPLPEISVMYSVGRTVRGSGERFVTEPYVLGKMEAFGVSAPGHASTTIRLDQVEVKSPEEPLVVRLPRPLPVVGRVIDPDGEPVAGLELVVSGMRRPYEMVQGSAVTAPDGGFETACGLPGGELFWLTRLPDGEFRRGGPIPVESDAVRVELEPIIIGRGWTLVGHVVDEAGTPIPHGMVTAHLPGGSRHLPVADTYLDPRGRFRLVNLPAESLTLSISGMDGRPEATRPYRPAGDEEILWRLPRGFAITGRVLDRSGEPRRGVIIRADPEPATTRTDDSGRFAFRGLAAGPHRVYLLHEPETAAEEIPGDTFDLTLRPPER